MARLSLGYEDQLVAAQRQRRLQVVQRVSVNVRTQRSSRAEGIATVSQKRPGAVTAGASLCGWRSARPQSSALATNINRVISPQLSDRR